MSLLKKSPIKKSIDSPDENEDSDVFNHNIGAHGYLNSAQNSFLIRNNNSNNSSNSPNVHHHNQNSYTASTVHNPHHYPNQQNAPNSNVTFRNMMHRPSVRSISELPNVIGAQTAEYSHDVCSYLLTGLTWFLVIIFFPFSLACLFRVVQEFERAVIFRLGRLKRSSCGPGVILVLPCIETMSKVDMRTVSFDVAPQEVLTKDSVTVAVDAVVYYRVFNPAVSIANVENAQESTRLLAQTSLRNVLGQKSLSEILSDRESVSRAMRECLDEATDPWGIEVERVEFKDVRLPIQLQRAMATEAEAAREARAKVIAAEGEQRAARALKGAADIIASSPCAIQLRYLQTLSNIATERNSTIIFPVPVELFEAFGCKSAIKKPKILNNNTGNNSTNISD